MNAYSDKLTFWWIRCVESKWISTGVCIAHSDVSDVPFVGTSTRIRRNRSLVSNAQEDLLIPTSRRKNSTRFLPRLFVPFLPDRVVHSDNQKEDFLALASTRKPDRYERLPNTWTRRVPRTFHILFSFSPSIRVCSLERVWETSLYVYCVHAAQYARLPNRTIFSLLFPVTEFLFLHLPEKEAERKGEWNEAANGRARHDRVN